MFGSVIDEQCSLADLQELEDGQLKLVEGDARGRQERWRPQRPGEGLSHTGISNVYNTEFFSAAKSPPDAVYIHYSHPISSVISNHWCQA